MKFRHVVAAGSLAAAVSFGFVAPAAAGPASAPNVVGLSEKEAVSVLKSQGIKVRVATRNGSGPRPDSCIVRHQQDLSGKTNTETNWKTVTDPVTGKKTREVASRTVVVTPPSTTLNVVC